MDDAPIHQLALAQQRIILTSNVKDFRRLLRAHSPGVTASPRPGRPRGSIPKLTALLTKHGPAYFTGRVRHLQAEEETTAA